MEWQKFLHSNSQESTFGQFNAPHINHEVVEKTGQWTLEEKQVFDNALSKLNPASPSFFDYVASILPHKSLEEIKNHYLNLFLIPENNVVAAADDDYDPDHQHYQLPQADDSDMVGRPVSSPQVEYNRPRRRKGIPWTEEEHQLFLMGLNTFGKGDWKNISRFYVVSKTPTQVASHAQKYFNRQNSTTPLARRRPSINDIQTVTLAPASTTTHQINGTLAQGASSMPSLHYPYNVAPMSSGHGNFGRFFSGAEASSSSSNNMVQQTINCNNINIHLKPVSPRPFF